MISADFLITSIIVVLVPGTGVIYTVSTGLARGWRGGIAAAIGCTAGIIPHLTAAVLGLSALMHMSAIVFQVMKYAGAAYLLFLAFSMWRDKGELSIDASHEKNGWLKIVLRGFLINILNPKLTLFFLAFLPLFIPSESSSPVISISFLGSIFMGITLLIFTLYGFIADIVRAYIAGKPEMFNIIKKSFAVALGAFGLKLALTDR